MLARLLPYSIVELGVPIDEAINLLSNQESTLLPAYADELPKMCKDRSPLTSSILGFSLVVLLVAILILKKRLERLM